VILVDTSIWIDHLRSDNPKLAALLQNGQVLAGRFISQRFFGSRHIPHIGGKPLAVNFSVM